MKQQNVFNAEVYILDFMTNYLRNTIDYKIPHNEQVWNLFIDTWLDYDVSDEFFNEAVELLKIPMSLALLYKEGLDEDIQRAYETAYRDMLEVQFNEDLQEHIEAQDHFSHYIDDKDNVVTNFWEAERAVFSITRKEIVIEWLDEPIDHYDINDIAESEQWLSDVDYKFSANLDNVYVYDEWQALLVDYSETQYAINGLINNRVA